jgi:hypothetical protein
MGGGDSPAAERSVIAVMLAAFAGLSPVPILSGSLYLPSSAFETLAGPSIPNAEDEKEDIA